MNVRLLQLAYRLRNHRLAGWGIDRWGITLAWGAAVVILLLWLLQGKPFVSAGHWAFLALLALAGLLLVILRAWAKGRSYVIFTLQSGQTAPSAVALRPSDKVLVRATGRFEVESRSAFFADLLAYWRTFASREHSVMAIAHESRFLGLGSRPAEELGMWYAFFRPETIDAVTAGSLAFGSRAGPALRIAYRHIPPQPDDGRRRAQPKPKRMVLYLACEDDETRGRIWADLLADGEELRIADC